MYLLIESWLTAKQCTLWADWDITDDQERQEAAAWWAAEMRSYLTHIQEMNDNYTQGAQDADGTN